jgi:hypothetical protein
MTERMTLAAEIMAVLERRRAESGDASLGCAIERALIDSHLKEIEEDILQDPGAIEPLLVRRRTSTESPLELRRMHRP